MAIDIPQILFSLFAVPSVTAALGVVLLRDPIKSALSLIGCFFCLASLFVLQSAELMGVLEVLVYAGAIMVLFIFVLMLVENKDAPLVSSAIGSKVSIPIKIGGVALIAMGMLRAISRANLGASAKLPEGFGNTRSVATHFFEHYIFHFELTSILLMVGIVGAVVVSKRGARKAENS